MKTRILAIALAAALATAGVTQAEETLGEKVDDAALVAKIKADLLKTRNVDGLQVNVDVKQGAVTLSGTASDEAERARAEQIAKGTSGVKSVENRITIKSN